eukprot:9349889-Pyramimonas_sp.AAC.1
MCPVSLPSRLKTGLRRLTEILSKATVIGSRFRNTIRFGRGLDPERSLVFGWEKNGFERRVVELHRTYLLSERSLLPGTPRFWVDPPGTPRCAAVSYTHLRAHETGAYL